ncbi:MAG: helix-turn-helix domain-containing protein [Gaiellaceae bacterium MAG52_C11]|nr:helix-turn-helix domain-containing protein [Candidatus Gaiellasilicea maunaloa]
MKQYRRSQSQTASRLTLARIARGVTQQDLADKVGVSWKTIRRLEANQIRDPGVRLLSNCALALNVKLESLIEPVWREWLIFDEKRAQPPTAEGFHKPGELGTPLWIEKKLTGAD